MCEPSVSLEALIQQQVEALPRFCKGLEGDFESHDWQTAYGDIAIGMPTELWVKNETHWKEGATSDHPEYTAYFDTFLNLNTRPTRMLPYWVCKHCHAVSEHFTSKRAR